MDLELVVATLDAVSGAGFLAALVVLVVVRDGELDARGRTFLALGCALYVLVAFSNVAEHGFARPMLDVFEDYFEILFVPFFVFFHVSRRANEELRRRLALETELARAERLEALGLLAGGVAHDFNNLLAVILGHVGMARELLPAGCGAAGDLAGAERAILAARELTRRLLGLSRGEQPRLAPVRPAEVLEAARVLLDQHPGVRCEISGAAEAWPMLADAVQLGQVFSNLLLNAAQAMPEGGTIRVDVESVTVAADSGLTLAPGRYVRIGVTDEGPGIPAEQLRRIFDPFHTTKPSGTGLGLAVCHAIVHHHGGRIVCEAGRARGARFEVHVPAAPAE
jgi:signal transduction histidine kinase